MIYESGKGKREDQNKAFIDLIKCIKLTVKAMAVHDIPMRKYL